MAGNLTAGLSVGVTTTSTNPEPVFSQPIGVVAASPVQVTSYVSSRTLFVNGTNYRDTIVAATDGTNTWLEGARILYNGVMRTSIPREAIDKIVVHAYDGSDVVDMSRVPYQTEIWGGDGADRITGSDFGNIIRGGRGGDTLNGGAMADLLFGDLHGDHLWGGAGADKLYGSAGDDDLHGGWDDDELFGEEGFDSLFGDDENDWLEAGAWFEPADGGEGVDYNAHVWAIDGAAADDIVQGNTNTCAFLSSLASVSRFRDLASEISYEGNYTYAVWLFDDAVGDWVQEHVHFDGELRSFNNLTFDATARTEGESWVTIYQRAYLQHFPVVADTRINDTNWILTAFFTGESVGNGLKALTGVAPTSYDSDKVSPEWLQQTIAAGPVATGDGVHCYALMDMWQNDAGEWEVQLYNPWGNDSTHTGSLTVESEPLSFTGSSEGYITVKWEAFKAIFEGFMA
jgi:hypothetical protein